MLLYWLEFCPFGIVLPGVLVSFPHGGFLTGVMFVSWFLKVMLVIGSLEVMGFVVFLSLALLVVLVFLVRAGFLGGFRRIRLNRKTPAHLARLRNLGSVSSRSSIWRRLRVSEARWCSICGSHVLHECHHSDDGSSLGDRGRVGFWGCTGPRPQALHEGVIISFFFQLHAHVMWICTRIRHLQEQQQQQQQQQQQHPPRLAGLTYRWGLSIQSGPDPCGGPGW